MADPTPYCATCGHPQQSTRSGLVCDQGHGGDASLTHGEALATFGAAVVGPALDHDTHAKRRFSRQPSEEECAEVDAFLAEVRNEILRARTLFPGDRIRGLALAEEFGELCKALLDESADRVHKEAVQTAAMAARIALDGDGSVREWRTEKGLDPLRGS